MQNSLASRNKSLALKLVLVVIGMFAFATLLLPPLYDVFCEITGLNGKIALSPARAPIQDFETSNQTAQTALSSTSTSSTSSTTENQTQAAARVNVEFTTKVHQGMPWSFKGEKKSIQVIPGEQTLVHFEVHNPTKNDMIGRAVPSISPASAAQYVQKMECFCFQEQPLAAGETKLMPLVFYLDADIPSDVKELTMSYTLYNKSS